MFCSQFRKISRNEVDNLKKKYSFINNYKKEVIDWSNIFYNDNFCAFYVCIHIKLLFIIKDGKTFLSQISK